MEQEEKKYREVELRSEEVQEVMNRIPPSVQRYGMGVLLGVVVMLLAGSLFFSYPETVEADFTLTTRPFPGYVQAAGGGRIEQLYAANGQRVKKGEVLGVIGNMAHTEDVLFLRGQLDEWKREGGRAEQVGHLFLRRMGELGNVQPAYSACVLAWSLYMRDMQGDRIREAELLNAVSALSSAIAGWEEAFLLSAPSDGVVAYMQPWRLNQCVEAGETVFVVVPEEPLAPVGKAAVPMEGIGKIAVGQRVVVRLSAFPEQEFGFIEGRVSAVSPVPTPEGMYILEVSLPDGLCTSYGRKLPLIRVLTGTASVVTRERNLFQRLVFRRL